MDYVVDDKQTNKQKPHSKVHFCIQETQRHTDKIKMIYTFILVLLLFIDKCSWSLHQITEIKQPSFMGRYIRRTRYSVFFQHLIKNEKKNKSKKLSSRLPFDFIKAHAATVAQEVVQ